MASAAPEDPDDGPAFTFDDALRVRLAANLARHERTAVALDAHHHAAVALVVVDSDAVRHGVDLHAPSADRLAQIPGGDVSGLTGNVAGTAGGPAVLLTRRSASLRAHAGQWALP